MDVYYELTILLMIVYLISGWQPPIWILKKIGSPLGYAAGLLLLFALLATENVALILFGFTTLYVLYGRAGDVSHLGFMNEFYPSERVKWSKFPDPHEYEVTLEEEIIRERAPTAFNPEFEKTPWRPSMDDTHNAALLTDAMNPILPPSSTFLNDVN